MKTLLMLGGGFLQNFVIKKAKELGYRVLVLDANPDAVGFKYADEHAVINIVDEDACLAYAREKKIDGVLTAATDFSVFTMSRIAEELKLPGINYNSAKMIKNKAKTRNRLYLNHVDDTKESVEVCIDSDFNEIADTISYPVMVKPCDGSGSRGASRVDCKADLQDACLFAINSSLSRHATIEQFIFGKEYGVESFVDNGVIHVLGVMQKDMTNPPYYAELGHAMPSGLSDELETKIKTCVYKALVALRVNHGSVNMDLLVTESGNVHIVDVGARMGGNLIGSHIINLGTGIAYMENMIKAAVGDPTDFKPEFVPMPVATKLLALTPGVVKELPNFDEIKVKCDVRIEHHLFVGDRINEYHTNLDGCGYVIATGIDVTDAIDKVTQAKKMIDENIVRE